MVLKKFFIGVGSIDFYIIIAQVAGENLTVLSAIM